MSAASPSRSRRSRQEGEPEEWDPDAMYRDAGAGGSDAGEAAREAVDGLWDAGAMIRQWLAAGAATAAQTAGKATIAGISVVKQAGNGVMKAAIRHRRGHGRGSRGKGQQRQNGFLDWRGKANTVRGALGLPPLKRPWKYKAEMDVFNDEMRRLKKKGQLPKGYENWRDPNERRTNKKRQTQKESGRSARDYKAGPRGLDEAQWKKLDKLIVEIHRSKQGDERALAAQRRSEEAYMARREANRPNGRDRSLIALSLAAEGGDPEAQDKLDRLIGNNGRRIDHVRQSRATHEGQPEKEREEASELQKRQKNRENLRQLVADEAELEWCKTHPLLGSKNTFFNDMEQSEITACKKGRIIAGNLNSSDPSLAAEELLKYSGENQDKRHKEIGHLVVSWHDERQADVGDEQRRWACRAALAARGIDPERHRWMAVEHEDKRIHLLFAKSRDDGARWDCEYPQQTSTLADAVADRLCTGRTRPDEDMPSSGRIHARGDAALAEMQRGEGGHVKFIKKDGKSEEIKMNGASIARRIADQAGMPPPEAAETGGCMSLPKHSAPAVDSERFCKYALG